MNTGSDFKVSIRVLKKDLNGVGGGVWSADRDRMNSSCDVFQRTEINNEYVAETTTSFSYDFM